jgi:hypothetical protein
MTRGIAKAAIAGVLSGLLGTAAHAQETSDAQADRLDTQIDLAAEKRREAIGFDEKAAPKTTFAFALSLPAAWTNNAGYSDDKVQRAVHFTPSAQAAVTHELRDFTLEGRATISSDSYTRYEDNNLSFVRLRLQVTARHAVAGFKPYLRYQPRVEFKNASFGGYKKTIHDFMLGASGDLGGGKLDLYVQRREATDPNSERWQPGARLAFKGPLKLGTPGFSWAIVQTVEGRFFSNGSNSGRHDFYSGTDVSIAWQPSPHSPLEIKPIQITAEVNKSDRAKHDYFVVNIGPSISLTF